MCIRDSINAEYMGEKKKNKKEKKNMQQVLDSNPTSNNANNNIQQNQYNQISQNDAEKQEKMIEFQDITNTKSQTTQQLIISPATQIRSTYGRCRPFWFKKGEPLITIGPHWFLVPVILFMMIFMGTMLTSLFYQFQIDKKSLAYKGTIFYFICDFLLYLTTVLKNQGILTANNQCPNPQAEICATCHLRQFPKTAHCDECGVCILNYDHHCPWTGKCIGKGNAVFFYSFIITTFSFFIFIAVATIL
eukprot:TRINITY_DN16624_c0_g1_i1.p1 TRINITY_DN16624_c0_g1~~TRINITY_DN16624_c0_g1_i1.p1  ORF type:complete len:247 (-),score=42.59 TRINITY_DN16624_c0_g1_i1:182-922(-)